MLVIVAGQSNALGYLNDGPAPYTPSDMVYIWNDQHGAWEMMLPGVNTGTPSNPSAWGPEVAFAADFHAAHPGEVLAIVKSVKGSTGVAQADLQDDWSPLSHGEMFDRTAAMVARALAPFGGVAGWHPTVLWLGGETDATYQPWALAHRDNLQVLVDAMRSEWGADHIEIAKIADHAELPYNEAVRWSEGNVDLLDPRIESFETSYLEMQPGNVHYAASAHVEIGHRFFDAVDSWYG